MLIYHPAFDAYHSIFRILVVIDRMRDIELDKARILEFYLLFPAALCKVRIPSGSSNVKKNAKTFTNPYHDPINLRSTFREMRAMQDAAIKCLAAAELIDKDRLEHGFLTRTKKNIPDNLKGFLDRFVQERLVVAEYIFGDLANFSLYGMNGLKDRTNLMEFRYDYAV